MDSNLHAFLWELDDQASYFCIYSCIFALEREISKYYVSSSFSYGQVLDFGSKARDKDFSEYGDPILIPMLHSERLEIISDGCQYKRSEKVELIADWDISKKFLNVCYINNAVENCSVCSKCVRTLLPLEALGKLDDYKQCFNIAAYKKIAFKEKCKLTLGNKNNAFATDNFEFCKLKGLRLPSKLIARLYFLLMRFKRIIRKLFVHK